MNKPFPHTSRHGERGNMLFIILIAVALIGMLTAAVQYSSGTQDSSIDNETLTIRAGDIQRTASELERAILFIRENGISESDIRFAGPGMPSDYGTQHASPDNNTHQVFHARGGAAKYRAPDADILAVPGGTWEFYGGTAIPQAGSDKADLVAVIPNVTLQFCQKINALNGITSQPTDDGGSAGNCVDAGSAGRFGSGSPTPVTYASSPNTMVTGSFSKLPAMQGCVQCTLGGGYHFYHVLLAR